MYSYSDIFNDKNRVLFVMAHPDDVDVFFGGIISKLSREKKEVFVLLLTNGARGSRDNNVSETELASTRIEEQKQALKCYGVEPSHFDTLNYKDGEAEPNLDLIGKIVHLIRKFKPDIVCTHNPNSYFSKSFSEEIYHVNHKDHRVCGIATMDAVYPFSRDRNFFEEHLGAGLTTHTVTSMLFTATPEQHNSTMDINEVIEKKRQGMGCHKSQFDSETVERILNNFKEDGNNIERGYYISLRK